METVAVISPPAGRRQARAAIELACLLPGAGERTLVVDLDPLARASRLVGAGRPPLAPIGARRSPRTATSADVLLRGAPLGEAVRPLGPRLELAPASGELAAFEAVAARERSRLGALGAALAPLAARYEHALCLAPAECGRALTGAVLAAADGVLCLVEPLTFGLRELERLVGSLTLRPGAAPTPWIALLGFTPRSPLTCNLLVALRARYPASVLAAIPDPSEVPAFARRRALQALAGELRQRLALARRARRASPAPRPPLARLR